MVDIFWGEKFPESPEIDVQRYRSLYRNINCSLPSVHALILLCDRYRYGPAEGSLYPNWWPSEVLRWLIVLSGWNFTSEMKFFRKTKRKNMTKAAILHRCEQEAPAAELYPKDVYLPKITLLTGQQTRAVQEVSRRHHRRMHYQASIGIGMSKLKNKCSGEGMCYVWLTAAVARLCGRAWKRSAAQR